MLTPRSLKLLLACTALFVVAAGCANRNGRAENIDTANRHSVVVSIPPLQYFAESIGGERVSVKSLTASSADPETLELSVSTLKTASESPLLLTVGLLPFEEKVKYVISASRSDVAVVSLYAGIDLIEGTHDHGKPHDHHHDDECNDGGSHSANVDPHIWTSLRNARIIARNTYRALASRFPADSLYFRHRLDSLDHRLDSLDRVTAIRLAPYRGEGVLVWHPSLSYFTRDYGLKQIAVGHEHKESSIIGIKERIDLVIEEHPRVFFYQKEYDSRQAATITEATGLTPVVIAPLSPDIEQAIKTATDAIVNSSPYPDIR